MRTSIIKHFIRKIFVIFTVLTLTACTGKNDFVLESVRQEDEAEKMPGAEGAVGMAEEPETVNQDGQADKKPGTEEDRRAGNLSAESRSAEEAAISDSGIGNAAAKETALPDIYVHICGAVRKPGVYVLEAGSRVYEGVAAAGGFAEDACEEFVNQAGVLTDGQRLVIPTMEEAEAVKANDSYQELRQSEFQRQAAGNGSVAGEGTAAENGTVTGTGAGNSGSFVNINTATESELSAIPGIGAGKAAAIVKYRQENGAFASIEDIMKVSGIKQGTFEKIKDKITVN